MTPFFSLLLGALITLTLVAMKSRFTGFRTQRPADLATRGPRFHLRTHLSGPILCEGVIYGPTGRVASRFVAEMEGVWDGNTGVLKERFRYDEWRLFLSNDGAIRAEADDVVGAGSGRAEGPAVQLRYRIRLEPDAGGHVLDVTDWMYLMENGTIMNRSQFTKFGINVAELVATIRPVPVEAQQLAAAE